MLERATRRRFLGGIFALPSLSAAMQEAVSPYRRPRLKITDVRTAEVRVHGYQLHVRIYTDQGVFGHGEGTDAIQGGVPLVQSWRRMLMGQDPLNVDAVFERIRTSGVFAGAQAGQYVSALSAVEIALWDLAGKAVGLPVYQLLGGRMRDRIRVYCDSGLGERGPAASRGTRRSRRFRTSALRRSSSMSTMGAIRRGSTG